LECEFAVDIGDFHGDLEEMLFGVGEGELVADFSVGGGGEEQTDKEQDGKAKSGRRERAETAGRPG